VVTGALQVAVWKVGGRVSKREEECKGGVGMTGVMRKKGGKGGSNNK
jgi:hypothetical protein